MHVESGMDIAALSLHYLLKVGERKANDLILSFIFSIIHLLGIPFVSLCRFSCNFLNVKE